MREYAALWNAMEESTELNFGIASMDREHVGQLSMLNDLKAAVRSGADESLVYALLNELVEHTNLHFSPNNSLGGCTPTKLMISFPGTRTVAG